MRVFLVSLTAVALIALSGAAVLLHFQEPAAEAFATTGARV